MGLPFIYKWLPILFKCHCRPDRSFFIRGKQFPICARCTGQLIGFFGALISFHTFKIPILVLVALMLPLIVDGTVQQVTSYESNNLLRLITGILFGYSLITLIVLSMLETFQWGYELGLILKNGNSI